MPRPLSETVVYCVMRFERYYLYVLGIERYICVIDVLERQFYFVVQYNVVSLDDPFARDFVVDKAVGVFALFNQNRSEVKPFFRRVKLR